ncbi:MAG TPA: TerB family tellurite resistance protein [Sandaracinaceae bacterium LLY-WYZ-13_1]|nr:TerB family tellurite resistance protein [Sandaracinaceae bacterium LLY-WYZ-13_1]
MDVTVARCLLIAKVLASDGIMTDEERAFLESSMEALGLSEDDRARVRDLEGWDEAEPLVAALSEAEKREFMDGLVQAVLADGKVSPHEMQTIEKLSSALGLD